MYSIFLRISARHRAMTRQQIHSLYQISKRTLTEMPRSEKLVTRRMRKLRHPCIKLVLYYYLFSYLLETSHCYLKLYLFSQQVGECLPIDFSNILYTFEKDWAMLNCWNLSNRSLRNSRIVFCLCYFFRLNARLALETFSCFTWGFDTAFFFMFAVQNSIFYISFQFIPKKICKPQKLVCYRYLTYHLLDYTSFGGHVKIIVTSVCHFAQLRPIKQIFYQSFLGSSGYYLKLIQQSKYLQNI